MIEQIICSRGGVGGSDNIAVNEQQKAANRDLATMAKRLRAVRRAQKQFLTLWAMDCLMTQPTVLDRLVKDLEARRSESTIYHGSWDFLYRGSVLDD